MGDKSDLFVAENFKELEFKINEDNIEKDNDNTENKERDNDIEGKEYDWSYDWDDTHWVGGRDIEGIGNFKRLDDRPIPSGQPYWKYPVSPYMSPCEKCVAAQYEYGKLKLLQSNCETFKYFICKIQ